MSERGTLHALVLAGLEKEAVLEAATHAREHADLDGELRGLPADGYDDEASLIELVSRNRDAARLAFPLPTSRPEVGRLVVVVLALPVFATMWLIGPWSMLVGALWAVALGLWWVQRRRRGLTRDEWHLIVDLYSRRLRPAPRRPWPDSAVVIDDRSDGPGEPEAPWDRYLSQIPVELPIVVSRPRPLTTWGPASMSFVVGVSLLFADSPTTRRWALVFWLVAAVVAARGVRAELVLDEEGVDDRGVFARRRFPWGGVHGAKVKDDGERRVRVELVTSSGETAVLWSGPSTSPRFVEVAAACHQFGTGGRPPRMVGRWLSRVVTVALVVVALVVTVGAMTMPFVEPPQEVDPAAVPPGTQLHVLVDANGAPRTGPRMFCPSLVARVGGDDVAVCAPSTRQSMLTEIVLVGLACGVWALLGWRIRRRRRGPARRAPDSARR